MRAVVTRVDHASVTIEGRINGQIGVGFLVLLGVGPNDTEETARKLADKICNLRIFEDENDKMNLNLEQVGGSLLVVSQFTLYADTSSRRPGFSRAAKPELAVQGYESSETAPPRPPLDPQKRRGRCLSRHLGASGGRTEPPPSRT